MEVVHRYEVSPEHYARGYRQAFGEDPPYPTAIAEIRYEDGTILWTFGDTIKDASEKLQRMEERFFTERIKIANMQRPEPTWSGDVPFVIE